MNKIFGWETFNDRLALTLILIIPVLWIFSVKLNLPETVIGATIATWTLIVQYYFRKRSASDN